MVTAVAGTPDAPPAQQPAEVGISTGALARRLGVSATTVRTWDRRYGVGPAVRSSGQHRRWTPQDVAVVEEMCRLTASGVPPAEAARVVRGAGPAQADAAPSGPPRPARPASKAGSGLPLGEARQECRGLARAAMRLDGPAVDALLAGLIDRHGLVVAWQEVMAPTLRAVGRKWQTSGERYAEVEHLLSWHVSSALRRLPGTPPAAGATPVLLAGVPHDPHTLALEALAAGLSSLGVATRMFGGAVPADALDEAVRRIGPAAVVLWSQSRATADRRLARRVAATSWGVRGARAHPLVLLAGPGWAGPLMPGMLRPQSLLDALSALAEAGSADGAAGGPVPAAAT
ncbi:MerR family transcriptional regulator [Streptomyces sp. NPDC006733]|uniref:MerR family transcriptional regulator n=1 Tax=Streptomyces sp. NPDC006733 TaxID=3155460 RepID=UPI0033EE37B8